MSVRASIIRRSEALTVDRNFAGYSSRRKHHLYETQVRLRLKEMGLIDQFDILEFQMIGNAREDPRYMFESTTYSRIFAQAKKKEPLSALKLLLADQTQQKPSVRSFMYHVLGLFLTDCRACTGRRTCEQRIRSHSTFTTLASCRKMRSKKPSISLRQVAKQSNRFR